MCSYFYYRCLLPGHGLRCHTAKMGSFALQRHPRLAVRERDCRAHWRLECGHPGTRSIQRQAARCGVTESVRSMSQTLLSRLCTYDVLKISSHNVQLVHHKSRQLRALCSCGDVYGTRKGGNAPCLFISKLITAEALFFPHRPFISLQIITSAVFPVCPISV